jgi:hypothetical protein
VKGQRRERGSKEASGSGEKTLKLLQVAAIVTICIPSCRTTVCGVYCWSVVVSFFLFALQLSSGGCGIACGGFGSVATADGDWDSIHGLALT